MNRFAALIDRLAAARGADARRRLLADFFETADAPDRSIAANILTGRRSWKRVSLPFIRGIADARIDPTLFALSLDHVGDPAETLALTWPARAGANRDPSLSEIVDGLSSLGKSELGKRLEAWLDAADAAGRWTLIKLATGTLAPQVDAADVEQALAIAGVESTAADAGDKSEEQNELFALPDNAIAQPGRIAAVLLYVERGWSNKAPLVCSFGLWNGDALVPVGKANVDPQSPIGTSIEQYVQDHTTNRFGPVREVEHSRNANLSLDVSYAGVERSPRRKARVTLRDPCIVGVMPSDACADGLAALEALFARSDPV